MTPINCQESSFVNQQVLLANWKDFKELKCCVTQCKAYSADSVSVSASEFQAKLLFFFRSSCTICLMSNMKYKRS